MPTHDPSDIRFGTKGTHVIKARFVIDDRLGRGTFQKLIEAAGANTPAWANPLAMNWYSAYVLTEVLTEAARRLNTTLQQLTTDIAELNAKDDLKTVYRFFMSVIGPGKVLDRSPRMYSTYINFGRSESTRNQPGLFEGIVADIPPALMPWVTGATHGFLPSACRAAGGKDPVITSSVSPEQGDPSLSRLTFSLKYG